MTHYRFTQSVGIAKQTFMVGIREVSAEIEAHPDFLHFVEAGWIHEVDPAELVPEKPKNFESRSAELAKRLAGKKMKQPEQAQEPVREKEEITGQRDSDLPERAPASVPEDESALTPQQRAALTRKANAEKSKAKES